jgi:hypothetical protein
MVSADRPEIQKLKNNVHLPLRFVVPHGKIVRKRGRRLLLGALHLVFMAVDLAITDHILLVEASVSLELGDWRGAKSNVLNQ